MGLQKFTNSKLAERMPSSLEDLLNQINKSGKISLNELLSISDEEKEKIKTVLTGGYLTLADEDREVFIENTNDILSAKSRNEIWERNHYCILNIISWQTMSTNQIPTIKAITEESGLSRTTVTKHLKNYYESDAFKEKQTTYEFLREKLLVKLYKYAYEGNMRAAKIFLASISPNKPEKVNKQQNNYIQINGLTITEQDIQGLPPKIWQSLTKHFKRKDSNETTPRDV